MTELWQRPTCMSQDTYMYSGANKHQKRYSILYEICPSANKDNA